MGGHSDFNLFFGTEGSMRFDVGLAPLLASRLTRDNPVVNAVRTGSALKADADHAFPDIVDNYAVLAERFALVGGDGKERLLLQLKGSLNGIPGVFEWVVDPDETQGVVHRRFIRHGRITGKPNSNPKKG